MPEMAKAVTMWLFIGKKSSDPQHKHKMHARGKRAKMMPCGRIYIWISLSDRFSHMAKDLLIGKWSQGNSVLPDGSCSPLTCFMKEEYVSALHFQDPLSQLLNLVLSPVIRFPYEYTANPQRISTDMKLIPITSPCVHPFVHACVHPCVHPCVPETEDDSSTT